MKEELTKLAKKNLRRIKSFQIVATTFLSISFVLFMISTQVHPNAQFWINLPSIMLMAVLGIIYVAMFGFSIGRGLNLNYDDEQLDQEISRLYAESTEGLVLRDDIGLEDQLDIHELEQLRERVKIEREI